MKGRTSKRILSALLSLVMLLSLLPVSVFATETETTKTAALVTDASTLKAGDQIILTATANEKTYVASSLSGKYLTSIECDPAAPTAAAEVFTLGGKAGAWTLTGSGGKQLYTKAAKALNTTGNGTGTWTISIDKDNLATVASTDSECGRFLYNVNTPRFLNYTSATNKSMLLPSIYKLNAGGSALEQVATPTGTASGDIKVGDTVSFTCETVDAALQYKIGDGTYQPYTGPVTITTSCTIYVKAAKDGMTDSKEAVFNYKAYELVNKYVKTTEIADGDQVVIYNAGNGYAVSSTILSKYYLTPVTATVTENVLTADSMDALVWTVTKNNDGTYTFVQGDKTLSLGTSADGKFNLNLNSDGATKWDVETCSAENASYYMSGNGVTGQYGKVYIEYYAQYTEFSAYCTSTDRLSEKNFGMTFYKLTHDKQYVTGETPAVKVATPTASPAAGEITKGTEVSFACSTAGTTIQYHTGDNVWKDYSTPIAVNADTTFTVKAAKDGMDDSDVAAFAYTVKAEAPLFQNGDKVVIYNPANMKALSTEYSSFYNKGTDVTLTNGKLTGYTEADVWTVGINADGTYTFSTADGKKLSMDTSYSSMPLDKANTAWEVSVSNTTGCYYIKNAVRGNYIEWYAEKGNWSSYKNIGSNELLFAQAFYKVRESGIVTSLSDGDTVVVFNPANMKALSTEYSSFYNKGTDVTLADGKLSGYTKADIWTVGINADGTYTFSTADGQKLSMDTSYSSMPLDKANTAWEISAAKTANCFYIKNANRGNYIEWYADKGNWSSYYNNSDEALFAQQFYLVVDDGSDTPDTGALPKAGDKVVIYSAAAQAALAAENDSQSIEKSSTTVIESGKLTMGNGAAIFTVEENGEYLRFYNETYGYLCSNGTGNNAFYSKDFSEEGVTTNDADWLVRTCSGGVGGFEMESRVAKYSGHSQWLEYYSDGFKTYSMYSKDGNLDYTIYSFNFYPVANGVRVNDGIVNDPSVWFDNSLDAYLGQDYTLPFGVDAPFGVKTISAKLGENDALTITEVEGGSYTVTVSKDKVVGDKLTITISGTDEKGVSFEGRVEIPVVDEPSIVDVFPAANAQTLNDKRPDIGATLVNVHENPIITMMVQGVEVTPAYDAATGKVTYTPAQDMADGKVVVSLTVKRDDSKEVTKTWSFTVGKAQFTAYFGQLHSHTQYSDGSGTLDSALDYVANLPESANVQFVAFTDHSNYFDTTSNPNPEGALYDMSLASADSQKTWNTYKSTIDNFNAIHSNIIAIGGFEMTWSGGPGHINTFNTPGIVSRNNKTLNNKTSDAGMKAYYALLSQSEGVDSISQFNHPGTTFGNFSDFSYWDPVIDSRMYMVEVGNGEGQIGAGGYYPSYEQYIMALDKGWHVAPTNNQDNHKGRWGNANDARDVILTDNFTEEGIYQAIRDMHMYATEDKNLLVNYSVNGQIMGSSITEVPEKLDISVSVNDPDPTDSIAKVEVVVNSGKVAYTWDNAAELATGELAVTLDSGYSYYFIRVTEADGDLAVTAPVWVGETLKLGISNLVCGTSTPVTNEELTLTTTLFNSETSDATVKSLTYAIKGGKVIGTDTTGYTVAASSTLDVPFKWTPTDARSMTITVTAVIEQDGKDYTFTKDITLDVLNADDLVYIGIDASHYNEYVNGNYKDSMGNFGELASKYSVRTVQLNTSADLIAACSNPKYKALILTAPSRRLAAAQADPKTYSAEELAAITAFNDAGGTVILAGWSDNYENYDVIQNNPAIKHMAATQNEVLAALGSSLRISDDATYDDDRSADDGVDKWRLYFSSYNMDNPLNNGVIFDADHPFDKLYTERFSHYGGASIYAVDANGNTTSTLPSTVSPVVYGHATTYSVDVDSDGLGGAGTPKYAYENDSRLMVMATEQLNGKGLIVVSGAAFMSNFEVQAQLDNGAEKNYSNYRICENLLNLLNPVKISTVTAVQAEKDEGVKFTIEAIVTSNASGYDKDTAFFDCIYVQDDTAGINCFPVAGNFKIGDKVRITGTTSSYQGERQLAVTSIEKIADATAPAPKDVTAAQVNDGSVLGSLIRVKGVITKVEKANGLVQTIMVRDANGNECRVFIDGYITTSEDVKNAEVGREIDVVGLASYDNTFTLADGTAIAPRIRIRDRADVKCGDMVDPGTCQHPSSSWKTVKSATCTATGTENLVCNRCSTILDTRTTAKLAHVDKNHDNKCDVCGKNLSTTVPSVTPSTPVKSGNTADNSNMGLWVVLMSLSLFGSVTLLRSKKRRA